MKHYFKVFIALISLSFKRFLEHRWNMWGHLSTMILSLLITIFFLEIIFSKVPLIYGWNKSEVFFLMGIFHFLVSGLFFIFFQKCIDFIPYYIHQGELDILLTKPINSQFYLSFRHMRLYELSGLLSGITLIIYSINLLSLSPSLFQWLLLFISIILGLVILYCIYFVLATLGFWIPRMGSLPEIFYTLTSPLQIPIDMLGKELALILTYVIPLGFIITVPVKIFLGKSVLELFFVMVGVSLVLLFLSSVFWNFALKHYTSASS